MVRKFLSIIRKSVVSLMLGWIVSYFLGFAIAWLIFTLRIFGNDGVVIFSGWQFWILYLISSFVAYLIMYKILKKSRKKDYYKNG